MNTPRYAAAAAKLIRQHLPSVTSVSGNEERGVATIERAMRARARRRRLVGVSSLLAAAAASLIVGWQVATWRASPTGPALVTIDVTPSGQGAALERGKGDEQLTTRASLESGQRIDTPANGGAALRLSTGTSMTLGGRTSFRVDSQGATQRFSLQQGELVAQVAKLHASQRFIVDTPDAEVEVRGTRFRLRVVERPGTCGAQTRTRLEVTEGVVEIRAASFGVISVKAGDVWPADCSSATRADESQGSVVAEAPKAPVGRPGASRPDARPASAAPITEAERASALTAANDLFAEGVARGRQGDSSGALRTYQELITRFPSSPLAENAMVARMRLLASTPEGPSEAKRYLARYPRGFAAGEATKLVAGQ